MTKLEELYTRGTTLKEVAPDVVGLPLKLWQKLDMERQGAEYRRTLDTSEAPLSKKAVATHRDNYGMKGF